MSQEPSLKDPFYEAVHRLRADYRKQQEQCNFWGNVPLSRQTEIVDGRQVETKWLTDGTPFGQCVRLVDIPGTLAGDIIRLRANLPSIEGHYEIDGNDIRPIENPPSHPEYPDDSEDIGPALGLLPVVEVDRSKHFSQEGEIPKRNS